MVPANRYTAKMTTAGNSRLILAGALLLLAGLALYAFGRPGSLVALTSTPAPPWTANLPSFLHTCGLAILIGLCAPQRRLQTIYASVWGLVACAAELGQLAAPPQIQAYGYRLSWTFDALDLLGCLAGYLVALWFLLRRHQ